MCLESSSNLRYLDLSDCSAYIDHIEEILASCYSLEKLTLAEAEITPSMIKSICDQNGKTLKILSLNSCQGVNVWCLQQILENCIKIKEINLGQILMWDFETGKNVLSYIAHNLPSGIEKLDLSCHQINDQFLSALIARCKNLRSLKLSDFTLTNDSLTIIMNDLKHSLEELDLGCCDMTFDKLLELKSMPKLKVLNYVFLRKETEIFVKDYLPHLSINKKRLAIGLWDRDSPEDGFWEIQSKQMNIFVDHKPRQGKRNKPNE